jgi:hypothetical protein
VQKYTAHEKIEFDITKEIIEKCHKEKKELDAVKNIVKNHTVSHKGEIHVIDDKSEIGLDNEQIRVLIKKHVTTWISLDDGVQPIYADNHDINNIYDPLTASLNNSPILKESLNAHMLLFRYSNRDMGIDRSIIVEKRNVGNPEYQITDELMQWMEDFNGDKKVSPITCFIEHRGVDIFTGVNARNGTVGIIE